MDNILNDINEQNKPVMLQRLREEINRQYKGSTWQELQLTDEQLLSVLDAHEQDWIIWELTTWQLKQKVETLDKTITDPNIRRFLLESGFCGKGFLNIFHNNEHTQQTPPQPGIKFQYESLDQKLMEQFDRYTPKTDRAKLFLRQWLYPTNRMFLWNNIIYLTDQIIDKYWRSMIIGYSWSKENNTIDLRLFYKSQSEWCRRACPWQRTDWRYSKWEFLTDFSYETTTKIHPKIWNYFDNLNKIAVNRSPILDILGSVNWWELLTKEMETSIHVQEALFPTMRFNKNKQSSYVIDSYNNLIPQGLDYKHMSNNPNKAYSYTHEYLWEIEVQVCTMKRYDRDIDIHFAHAKSSPDQVRIDNVVSSKARINSFGVYDYQINAWPLAAKPIDYNSQVPIDYRNHTTIPGTNYIDIRALYQNNPIIKAYKKNILKRTNK